MYVNLHSLCPFLFPLPLHSFPFRILFYFYDSHSKSTCDRIYDTLLISLISVALMPFSSILCLQLIYLFLWLNKSTLSIYAFSLFIYLLIRYRLILLTILNNVVVRMSTYMNIQVYTYTHICMNIEHICMYIL